MNTSENGDNKHIVSSYAQELERLDNLILEMGGRVEAQLSAAMEAIVQRNSEKAKLVIEADVEIDRLESQINELTINLLALRQPMASDLRRIVSAIKIAGDLERFGDYSKNMAKRTLVINSAPAIRPVFGIARMSERVQGMLDNVLEAHVNGDVEKAKRVWSSDEEVDDAYNSLFRELLTYMMEDPRNITVATHLLFVAKNIERMGDLVTNIAETIHYAVSAVVLDDERPKRSTVETEEVVAPAD